MKIPKVCVIRTAGTNCDKETGFAFSKAGGAVEFIHVNNFISARRSLEEFEILALPGGFSYGDDVASGKIFANELKHGLFNDIKKFVKDGKLIIGICNGFQILAKSGVLPGNEALAQEVSLIINDSGKFESRWVYLKSEKEKVKSQKCIWTQDLPEVIYLPVAHGEGKFVAKDKNLLEQLKQNGQVVLRYCDQYGKDTGYPGDPNGSIEHIAGICDDSGRVFGLMPHPERHIDPLQHPRHTSSKHKEADGMLIFRNAIEYARKHL